MDTEIQIKSRAGGHKASGKDKPEGQTCLALNPIFLPLPHPNPQPLMGWRKLSLDRLRDPREASDLCGQLPRSRRNKLSHVQGQILQEGSILNAERVPGLALRAPRCSRQILPRPPAAWDSWALHSWEDVCRTFFPGKWGLLGRERWESGTKGKI